MTHIANIPHIVQFGITHRNSRNANQNYFPIGDNSLIDTRNTKEVFITNGEYNNKDYKSIIIGDFIPFYFGLRTPMLYVIQKGGNFVPKVTEPEDIIYCVSSVQKIIDTNALFYFTDGHATSNLTSFYGKEKISDLNKLVDLKAANLKYWKDDNDLDLKRRKEAEFLVKNDVPSSSIIGYICNCETTKTKLLQFNIEQNLVAIRPHYFF